MNCWLWFNFRFEACSRCNYTTPLQINRHFLLKYAAITLKLFSFDASSWVKNASYTWYLPRIRIFVSFLTQWLLQCCYPSYLSSTKLMKIVKTHSATIKIEFTFVYRIPGHGRLLLANAMLGVKSGSFEIFGGLLKFISSLCLV